jgi:outer membrane receptor protein involved in Fe transport
VTKSNLLTGTTLMAMSVCLAQPAFAQQTAEDAAATNPAEANCLDENANGTCDSEEAEEGTTIVVTGSRIARPNLESTVPVTTIQGEDFFKTGQVAIGDVINELPALRSTFGQSNSTRFLGTAGLNLLDLRGLGTQRTLVLVNGRRHVASDILSNATSPDVNTFPTDLVERVDIVTGGNSAIYGSDAIAGVVNFVLKRDFDGLSARAQGGISDHGDAGAYFVSLTGGQNFAEDRGNIAINLEYARQEQYFADGRSLQRQDGFVVVDTDPSGSDGTPDRLFFRDIRSATLNNTGLVRFGGTSALNCGTAADGSLFNCPFAFQPDGTLAPVTGNRIGIGPNGSFTGGNGENFRGQRQFQLSPQLERYNANLIAHFTISDAFEPFVEAKYARTDSFGSGNSGPAFFTGTTLGDSEDRERPRLDNPYLSAQARDLIVQQLTLQNGVAPASDARFSLRENLLGLGVRSEEARRETYRIVGGVRGEFNDDWRYEVSANYGEFRERTRVLGNLNVQRFLLAADAATNPANGQIQCRASFDPAARVGYIDEGDIFAADVAACTPINLFGGQFTQAQRDYLLADTVSVGRIKQFVGSAFLSGDSSDWFELPGGPIGFAIGAEYRRERNFYRQDPLVEAGYTFYNVIPTFDPPAFEVKEAFGEIRLPILSGLPFAEELTLSAAGRVADYKGATGTVYAYNGGIDYAPVRGLRLRANYSRAVRAPNLVELFTPPGQNFATIADPCSARNIGTGSATRAANCAAAGAPAGFDFVYSQSLEIVSGGNPDLREETSNSFTVGGVFQPDFVPGLSLSVDYYDIEVKNVISAVSAQTIVDQCYDSATLENQYCPLFQRNSSGAAGPRGEIPFQILEGSLLQSSLNFASLRARGIDAELAYRYRFDEDFSIDTRLTYTHVFQRDDFLNPDDPSEADQLLLELGDPQDEFTWSIDGKIGDVTLGYRMRYIGKQVLNAYEDFFSVQGREPENADYADRRFYPAVFYHNIRIGFDAGRDFNFYAGVDNITDRAPPLGLTGIGGGSGIYDVRGRYFYSGVAVKF